MKLRNKKTGEIEYLLLNSIPVSGDIVLEYIDENAESGYSEYCRYSSLAELNEEWEDCNKPAEPLIKDEKIRKIVRAWADNLQAFMCDGEITFYDDKAYRTFQTDVWKGCNIRDIAELNLVFDEDSLEDGKIYTIAELCGEGEDCNKPAEPLIKDEKIRKAVRTWAEANAVKKAEFEYVEGRGSYLKDYFCEVQIEFYDDLELTNRKTYTIAELCGEEDKEDEKYRRKIVK